MFSPRSLLPIIALVTLCPADVVADAVTCRESNSCPGAPLANAVNGDVLSMTIFEGLLYMTPLNAAGANIPVVAGDVVLCEDGSANIACFNSNPVNPRGSDVLHFINDLTDNGNGTGTGTLIFMFADPLDVAEPEDIPFPLPLSTNAVAIDENSNESSELTVYTACNATGLCNTYQTFSDTPEPSLFAPVAFGVIALALIKDHARSRRRRVTPRDTV
jgi:hypothetical protein